MWVPSFSSAPGPDTIHQLFRELFFPGAPGQLLEFVTALDGCDSKHLRWIHMQESEKSSLEFLISSFLALTSSKFLKRTSDKA